LDTPRLALSARSVPARKRRLMHLFQPADVHFPTLPSCLRCPLESLTTGNMDVQRQRSADVTAKVAIMYSGQHASNHGVYTQKKQNESGLRTHSVGWSARVM